ncbi:MAG: hypothetical protein ABI682_02010 [Acidobacteriota bacterium]
MRLGPGCSSCNPSPEAKPFETARVAWTDMTPDNVKLLSWSCRFCGQRNYRPLTTEIQEGKVIPLVCRRCDASNREAISSGNIIEDRRQRPRV